MAQFRWIRNGGLICQILWKQILIILQLPHLWKKFVIWSNWNLSAGNNFFRAGCFRTVNPAHVNKLAIIKAFK